TVPVLLERRSNLQSCSRACYSHARNFQGIGAMRIKHLLALMGTSPVLLLGYHTGPPIKRTGTIDGGTTCTACHRTFAPANSDATGSVTIDNLQPYVPGATQTIKITVKHPEAARWGFQLTARFVTGNGTVMAGTFAPADAETKVQCDDG